MAPTQRKPQSGLPASDDGMKGLLDLFSRNPTPARVTMHVERLLAGWRDALGDCRKIGGGPASWVFSHPFSDLGWMRGLDVEVGENRR